MKKKPTEYSNELFVCLFIAIMFSAITMAHTSHYGISPYPLWLEYSATATTGILLTSVLNGARKTLILSRTKPKHPLPLFISLSLEPFSKERIPIIILWAITLGLTLGSFTTNKSVIPFVSPFSLDAHLMRLDKIVFLGHTPWTVTHNIFRSSIFTWAISQYYHISFIVFWLSLGLTIIETRLIQLRTQYCLATMLSFIIIGNIAATFLSSAGPCYYDWLVGSPSPYNALVSRLSLQNRELAELSPPLHLYSLDAQDYLRTALGSKALVLGGGISAMPSMHVSSATLAMLAGRDLHAYLGRALGIGVFITWIGSIHLGWHYAVDGILAFAMTLLIWVFTGRLTSKIF